MRKKDFQFMFAFIKRAGMYTASNEDYGYKGVGTFLYAYEAGSNGECDFRSHIIKNISEKYGIPLHNGGIEYQLKLAAEKVGIEWYKLFKKEANATLVELSDAKGQNIFALIIRENLLMKLKKLGDIIQPSWRIDWNHTIDQIEDWKGVSISNSEKEKFNELMTSLTELSNVSNESEIKLSDETKNQIENLMKLIESKKEI